MVDGEPLDIIGIGDVRLKMPNGSVWRIQKVIHAPSLMRNLISVGQLHDEGHNVVFCSRGWKVTKGAMVVARAKKNWNTVCQFWLYEHDSRSLITM